MKERSSTSLVRQFEVVMTHCGFLKNDDCNDFNSKQIKRNVLESKKNTLFL